MEPILHFIDFILHLDHHLTAIIDQNVLLAYSLLFLIIFCETGLVFTPFLPGDSLLFVVGTIAATETLKIGVVAPFLIAAAILGDSMNYYIGHLLAPRVFRDEHIRFLRKDHLKRTEKFFEKYGAKTIIIARFIPIIRTFAPFLAGIGSMKYPKFLLYNVTGGVLWVGLCIFSGYFFGNLPFVKKHFSLVVLAIIIISIIPAVVEVILHHKDE